MSALNVSLWTGNRISGSHEEQHRTQEPVVWTVLPRKISLIRYYVARHVLVAVEKEARWSLL